MRGINSAPSDAALAMLRDEVNRIEKDGVPTGPRSFEPPNLAPFAEPHISATSKLESSPDPSDKTGTVWDRIEELKDVKDPRYYLGLPMPRTFIFRTDGGRVFVPPNATDHIADDAAKQLGRLKDPKLVDLQVQIQLTSLYAAVSEVTKIGVDNVETDRPYQIGQWILRFSRNEEKGPLLAIKHASRFGKVYW